MSGQHEAAPALALEDNISSFIHFFQTNNNGQMGQHEVAPGTCIVNELDTGRQHEAAEPVILLDHEIDKLEGILNVWYTNADTLTNKIDELEGRVSNCREFPHIIAITETWPKNIRYEVVEAELQIQGYQLYHSDINIGRGICIYIHLSINDHISQLELKSDFNEYLSLSIKLKGSQSMAVIVIYRSPSSTEANNERLNSLMKEINELHHTYKIVMGDFNYPQINWESDTTTNHQSQKFLDKIISGYWTQNVKGPTRYRGNNIPTLLDLVFSNEESLINRIDIREPLGFSDHTLIDFDCICSSEEIEKSNVKYLMDKGNYVKFREKMSIDWKNFFTCCQNDIEKMWDKFKGYYYKIQDMCIPKVTFSGGRNKWKIPLDEKLRGEIRKKHRAWKRYVETKDEHKLVLYKRCRNKVRTMTRRAVKTYEINIALEAKKNPKKFWSYVKRKTKVKESIPEIITSDGVATDDLSKAEALNSFFASVFVDEPMSEQMPELEDKQINVELCDLELSPNKIKEKLQRLKIDKTPGPDCIHPRILKEIACEVAEPLYHLFNTSYNQGKLPNEWKSAYVSALHKKGQKNLCSNYRPVSLTSVICKQMESFIRDQIMSHMRSNSLLSPYQFGFINKRSTTLQLLRVLDRWTQELDQGNEIESLYLDFQKAFDSVPHRRLISKLKNLGITSKTLNWTEDFLKDRYQQVSVNGVKSEKILVKSGIPQGSILGPVLFVVYINDLPESVNSEVMLFADDAKLFQTITKEQESDSLPDDLKSLEEWSSKWLLCFNPDKCKRMQVSRNPKFIRNNPLTISTVPIQTVSEEKDLGINIDNRLSFESHILKITKKAHQIMGIIRRTFQNLEPDVFLPLYKSLVRSHLEYGHAIWNPYLLKHIRHIEKVQRYATRCINGFKHLSYPERLSKLKLPTLRFRRLRGDVIEVYKLLNGLYDEDVKLNLQPALRRTRGHDYKLYKGQTPNTELRRHFFSNRIVDVWNGLPEQVVMAVSLNSFKNQLDKYWKDHPLLYDPEGQ